MKRNRGLHLFAVLLAMTVLLSTLAGCGGGKNNNGGASSANTGGESLPTASQGDGQQASSDEQVYIAHVSSTEELLEAIRPDVEIVLEPGYYNMSEYLEEVWATEGESWNERHPYVQLQECYDGVEVLIRRVDTMSIWGNNEDLTEIVVDPRYAAVLNFEECYDITLSGLTMGHTETGDCSGNVLNFYRCRDIQLSAMDLYGCGVYGLGCYDGTGELYVYSSTIRDCAYGSMEIYSGMGRFEFRNCSLTGSNAFSYYEPSDYSELAFYECVFGDKETSYFMFREDIIAEDCVWSDNYEYPEYGGEDWGYDEWIVFEPETMQEIAIDEDFLNYSSWAGYAFVNPESGETTMLPYEAADGTYYHAALELYKDGTGYYEYCDGITDEYGDFDWMMLDASQLLISLKDGRSYHATAYTMGGESYTWLLLSMDYNMVWLY